MLKNTTISQMAILLFILLTQTRVSTRNAPCRSLLQLCVCVPVEGHHDFCRRRCRVSCTRDSRYIDEETLERVHLSDVSFVDGSFMLAHHRPSTFVQNINSLCGIIASCSSKRVCKPNYKLAKTGLSLSLEEKGALMCVKSFPLIRTDKSASAPSRTSTYMLMLLMDILDLCSPILCLSSGITPLL